jgi:hypothetical protein
MPVGFPGTDLQLVCDKQSSVGDGYIEVYTDKMICMRPLTTKKPLKCESDV